MNLLNRWRYRAVLKELANNDGACLYWQMTSPNALAALTDGVVRMEDDLLIHPDAVTIEYGMAYTMTVRP